MSKNPIQMHKHDEIDLDEIVTWTKQAGEMALARFRHVDPMTKAGGELVTLADREIETFLVSKIRTSYPQDQIIGEEWGLQAGANARLWAIDPIDGTRSFISGLPIWGVSIGIVEDEQATRGVFSLPLLGEYYTVDKVGAACLNGRPLPKLQAGTWDRNALLCVPSDAHRRYELDFEGITRSLGSTAAHIIYVARGTAIGALIRSVHLWDIVAALAILYRVGGGACYLSGEPVELSSLLHHEAATQPFLVAHPHDLPKLLERIKPRPDRA